jgi:predicted RNA binding protein YcfA (HicA-like mRNA interferase family)
VQVSYRQAIKALRAAGFRIVRTDGDHEIWKHPKFEEPRVVIGFHGSNEPLRPNELREYKAGLAAATGLAVD